ncbi:MAG TPA: tetratricopeptide repeat protein [Burkholderiales bacterium]|nr:tetratricopeptide repeat protein [Burkholderiales bacterium]
MLKRFLFTSALALLFGSSLALAGPEEDYKEGRKEFESGDQVAAIPKLKAAADQGHVRAQTLLGYILDVSEYDEEAVKYYQMAADKQDPEGLYALGGMYAAGEGVKQDPKKALELIRASAELGYETAINAMALAYWERQPGVDPKAPDFNDQALVWFRRAAEKGYPSACSFLAKSYGDGLFGLAKDPEQAKQWEAKYRSSVGLKPDGKKK